MTGDESQPHYTGHRQRLRQRFLEVGEAGLQDYELIELVLFGAIPQKDVKPLAKSLLAEFKGLWEVFNATPERLQNFGLKDTAIVALTVVGAAALRATRQEIVKKPVLGSWQKLISYCQAAMGHETNEQFRLLFLDHKNQLLCDEVQQHGTINHTPVYVREVIRRALELGASSIILAHNHPSGDPSPSQADIELTREIVTAAKAIGINVLDHVIVGKGQTTSLKNLGFM